ncbi:MULTISPECIES: hypothetical protein [unclassified Bradyrhizobium]|uniref:hypothetical protein n=1 Tax=unclassified Bradyrhizobium TaxID=2631580 RepID=UPI0028EB9145|nr:MULTISPECIES: hypothetical protein [unclassified Bradyrhizobium]
MRQILLASAAIATMFSSSAATAGYVTFIPYDDVPVTYWTIHYHTGGSSNLALQRGTKQCQSGIEPNDRISVSKTGIPAASDPGVFAAPWVLPQCR